MSDGSNQKTRDYHETFNSEAGKRVLADLYQKFLYQGIVSVTMNNEQVRQLVGSWNVINQILYYLGKEIPAQ